MTIKNGAVCTKHDNHVIQTSIDAIYFLIWCIAIRIRDIATAEKKLIHTHRNIDTHNLETRQTHLLWCDRDYFYTITKQKQTDLGR